MADRSLELALRVKADTKQVRESLDALERELRQTGNAADSAARGGKKTARSMDRIARGADKARSSVTKLAASIAAGFAIHEMVRFTHALVEANTEAQRIKFTFDQAFGDDAQAQLKFVRDLSNELGLSFKETAESFGQIGASAQGTGVQARDLQILFRGLSEAATVLHTPASELNATFLQLAQGISLGKLQMQDIRAIAQHLPGTMSILQEAARRLGTTLEDALAHGGLDARKAIAAIGEVAHERFGVQAVEASHSLNAELNRLHSTLFELKTDGTGFGETFAEAIRTVNTELTDPAIQKSLKDLITGFGDIASGAVKAAAQIGELFKALKGYAEYAAKMQHGAAGDDVSGLMVEKSNIQAELKQRQNLPVLSTINSFLAGTENNPVQNALEGGRPRIQAMSTEQLQSRLRYIQTQLDRQKARLAASPSSIASSSALVVTPGGSPTPPTPPDNSEARKKAAALAKAAASANDHLRDTFIQLQAAQDPATAAWVKYNQTMAKAHAAAAKAKQATDANVEAIDGYVAGIEHLAAATRDAALDELAEKDRKAWEQFRASLQTPLEAHVSEAVAAIDTLNAHMAKGKLTASQYQGLVNRIFAKAVGQGQLRRVHNPGPGGRILDLQAQEQSDFARQMQLAQAVRDAILQSDQAGYAERLAAQRAYQQQADRLTRIHAQNQRAIEVQKTQFTLSTAQQGFTALAQATANAYGEQSTAARAAFALQKGAAVASGILAIQQSIANSAKLGYPWNIVAIAGAVAQGAALIANIRSVTAGYASGGAIRGEGTGTSDSIPIMASNGEYMQRAAAVKYYGVDFMDALNGLQVPRFASGGLIGGPADFAGVAPPDVRMPALPRMPAPMGDSSGQRGQKVGVRIINSVDPQFVTDNMASAEGENVILNTIAQNQSRVKQMIG